ncbi:helix-turn-helix domain-containing protein [Candidatus Poriferisodalis sp.]|uniref:helix-turn-helix domain-containing protein n=1 Tax=Candidatus Poriferisodalis sp. TaxID=3101277 RepID=UPI003B01F51F
MPQEPNAEPNASGDEDAAGQAQHRFPYREIIWLSTQKAANRIGITTRTLYRFIDRGELPAYRFGRVIRLRLDDVDGFVEQCRVAPGSLEHLYPEARVADTDMTDDEAVDDASTEFAGIAAADDADPADADATVADTACSDATAADDTVTAAVDTALADVEETNGA